MARILIAEDDPAVNDLIRMNLELVDHDITSAFSGDEALLYARNARPDLAIVDLMLPEIDGFTLTEKLFALRIPVVILTAKASLPDRVRGLNIGADDYITKPFEAAELLARVGAVLRRTQADEVFHLSGVDVHLTAGCARKNGKVIPLTNKEFSLLCALVHNRNLTLSREKLLSMVWGYDFFGETRTVDLHVQRLRKKLQWEKHIIAAYKQGYRLETSP